MSLKLDAESYLRSGSNELRVLEYRTTNMSFGINILKVSKIVSDLVDFTALPESHPAIKGVFKEMNRLVPVIDLAEFLGVANEQTKREKVIVTEFFGVLTGIWVHKIDWIHHFQWEDVIDAEQVFANIDHRYVLGIVKPTEDRMVLLLDYETMLLDLCPHLRQNEVATEMIGKVDFSGRKILVVEDSPAVRAMLVDQFTNMGAQVAEANDGAHGWSTYQQDAFDIWRRTFNYERPHEALNMKVPAEVYKPSSLRYREVENIDYSQDYIVRRVDACGRICIQHKYILSI